MYVGWPRVLVDLGDEVGLVGGLFATEAEAQSAVASVLVVAVRVVEVAGGSQVLVNEEDHFIGTADGSLATGELALEGVESDGAFRVVILEPLGLGEAEGELGRRVVGEVLLHLLVPQH